MPTVHRSPPTTTTARTQHPPLALPGQLDDLALHHLAAHHQRVGLTAEEHRLASAHTSSPSSASASCAPWSAKRVRQRRWSSSWKPPDVGAPGRAAAPRPARGGSADGIGHAVLEVRGHDPHQRSLAPPGRLRP